MCFNSQVSLITFIIGILGSIRLYNLGYKSEAFFFAWVVLMQLIEYFLWNNQECNNINKNITNIGMLINHLEPVILWIAILYFNENKLPAWINAYMLIYLVLTYIYTKALLKNKNKNKKLECTTVTEESKPHLHWQWNFGKNGILFYTYFLVGLVLLSMYGLNKGFITALLALLSFGLSYYIYGNKKAVGAMWCFAASFGPWIIPILNSMI
jgi:hypothetical protein